MIRRHAHLFQGVALAVMAAGILMVWQPWFHVLFRWGFVVTIIGIIAFMVAAHVPRDTSAEEAR
jgi:hypothetical protein